MNTVRRESDTSFLATSRETIVQPLKGIDGFREVLFAPGAGPGIGDQCMCVPLVCALQARYPCANVTICTPFPDFWDRYAGESIRILNHRCGHLSSITDLVGSFDVTLAGYYPECLHPLSRSRAKCIFGAGERLTEYRCFFTDGTRCREIPLRHSRVAVTEARKFLALFVDFGICAESEASPWADLNERGPTAAPWLGLDRSPQILIHPTAAQPYKEWPLDRWKLLAADLLEMGVTVSVSCGAGARAEAVARSLARHISGCRLLPPMPWAEFVHGLRAFDLVLSGDTGIPHAIALDRPTSSLAIFGPTDPIRFCPPSDACFFVCPFTISRQDARDAVAGCLSLIRGERDRIAHDGNVADLANSATAFIGALEEARIDANPVFAGNRIQLLMREYRKRVRPEFRTVLAGNEDLFRRVSLVFRNLSGAAALEYLRQSPVYRSARWLAGHACGGHRPSYGRTQT